MSSIQVRPATLRDAKAIAQIHTASAMEAYRGLVPDDQLKSMSSVEKRQAYWREAIEFCEPQVQVAIDGDKPLFDCLEIRDRCAVFDEAPPAWATRGVCSIHAVMQSAEKAMRHELRQHTLLDIANRAIDKAPNSYGTQVVQWLTARSVNRRGEKSEESLPPARKSVRTRNRA